MGKEISLVRIYDMLFSRFGDRHWWPGQTRDEVIIGAILAQNVAWSNVKTAIGRLRERGILSLKGVLDTPAEELAPLIRSTRYYNQKAAKLKAFARFFEDEFDLDHGRMFSRGVSGLRVRMLAIKGLGPETVDSILLYAGDLPVFVIDSYTRRLLGRLGFKPGKESYAGWQSFMTSRLPRDIRLYKDFHAQIVCLCKDICKPVPRCDKCPLAEICAFRLFGLDKMPRNE
ncbi:MAG: endonuclease III domain-containing protein [Candidatus Syntrophosphaera sp.]